MTSKRILVEWILEEFQRCGYEDDWQAERFSVLGDVSGARHQHDDLDFFFFWKVYDRWLLARKSEPVFKELARLVGGGPAMIQKLAEVSSEQVGSLKRAFDGHTLGKEIHEAFAYGRGGWSVLAGAIRAAKKLRNLYGVERTSYIARWLANFICNRQRTGDCQELVHCINSGVEGKIRDLKGNWQMLPDATRAFLQQRLLSPEAHLPGSGLETLSYFFRDWKDVILWKYMWKHDEKNQDFWNLAYEILGPIGMGPTGKEMQAVLDFLGSCLSHGEIEGGALARVNTAVYRLMSAHGDMGIERRLRNLQAEKR